MTVLNENAYVAPCLTDHGEARLRTRGGSGTKTIEAVDNLPGGADLGAASTNSGTTATETAATV
jgi:hypothetical protein